MSGEIREESQEKSEKQSREKESGTQYCNDTIPLTGLHIRVLPNSLSACLHQLE